MEGAAIAGARADDGRPAGPKGELGLRAWRPLPSLGSVACRCSGCGAGNPWRGSRCRCAGRLGGRGRGRGGWRFVVLGRCAAGSFFVASRRCVLLPPAAQEGTLRVALRGSWWARVPRAGVPARGRHGRGCSFRVGAVNTPVEGSTTRGPVRATARGTRHASRHDERHVALPGSPGPGHVHRSTPATQWVSARRAPPPSHDPGRSRSDRPGSQGWGSRCGNGATRRALRATS